MYIYINTHTHFYIYIYLNIICVCIYMCVCVQIVQDSPKNSYIHHSKCLEQLQSLNCPKKKRSSNFMIFIQFPSISKQNRIPSVWNVSWVQLLHEILGHRILVVHDAQPRSGCALLICGLDGVGRGRDLTDLGRDGGLTLPGSGWGFGTRKMLGKWLIARFCTEKHWIWEFAKEFCRYFRECKQ